MKKQGVNIVYKVWQQMLNIKESKKMETLSKIKAILPNTKTMHFVATVLMLLMAFTVVFMHHMYIMTPVGVIKFSFATLIFSYIYDFVDSKIDFKKALRK